jgi:hypothetical protein
MRKFPVQHGGEPLLTDKQITEAEIAVTQHPRPRRRGLFAEPVHGQLMRR